MTFAAVLERLKKLENPYPGLRPFDTEDSHLFFGRDAHVAELANMLAREHFVAVVGVSGCGKSSLVRAGLIPVLQRGHIREAGTRWRIVICKPGRNPMRNLTDALTKMGVRDVDLSVSSHGLIAAAESLPADESLLVVVDQFEELFRYRDLDARGGAADRYRQASSDAAEFVQLLLAASRHYPPIYVVLTMRSDYLGDCAEFRDLPETLNRCQYLVSRLTRQERKEAIEGPLGRTRISPNLVQTMLNDVGDDPEQLPVLQHALMRTWEKWREQDPDGKRGIQQDDYEKAGGFDGALDQHATELMTTLPADVCRTIFKRLTARGRSNRERRDPAPIEHLWALCGARSPEEQQRVTDCIDRLRGRGTTFLDPKDGDLRPGIDVDITHESLIRLWRDLRDVWMPEEQKAAKTFLDLADRASNWKKKAGEELRGLDLSEAIAWNKTRNQSIVWAEHYADAETLTTVTEYVEASARADRIRRLRTNAYLWLAVTAAGLFALLAYYAYGLYGRSDADRREAIRLKSEATTARDDAQSKEREAQEARATAVESLAKVQKAEGELQEQIQEVVTARDAASRARLEGLPGNLLGQAYLARSEQEYDRALLLAIESLKRRPAPASHSAVRELSSLFPKVIWTDRPGEAKALAMSADGRLGLTINTGRVEVFEIATGRNRQSIRHTSEVKAAVFHPDSHRIATYSEKDGVRLFDAESGGIRWTVGGFASALAFSTDGQMLAIGRDTVIEFVEVATGRLMSTIRHPSPVLYLTFSPNNRLVATVGDDRAIRVFDVGSRNELSKLVHEDDVQALAFSPDSERVASTGDGTVVVFEARSGQVAFKTQHGDDVRALAFSPDGRWLATGGEDNIARVVDAASGRVTFQSMSDDYVVDVSFSPDSTRLVAASHDDIARVFNVITGAEMLRLRHDDDVLAAQFTLDGRSVVTSSLDGRVRRFELTPDELSHAFFPFEFFEGVGSSFSRYLFGINPASDTANNSRPNGQVYDLLTGLSRRFAVPPELRQTAVSADGQRVALQPFVPVTVVNDPSQVGARSGAPYVAIYDTTSGREIGRVAVPGSTTALSFSSDGRTLAVVGLDSTEVANASAVYDVATGKKLYGLPAVTNGRLFLSPDLRTAIVEERPAPRPSDPQGPPRTLRVVNLVTRAEISRWSVDSSWGSVDFSDDGRLASVESDKSVQIFDVASGVLRAKIPFEGAILQVAFKADGSEVAVIAEKMVRIFQVATGRETSRINPSPLLAVFGRYDGTQLILVTGTLDPRGVEVVTKRYWLRTEELVAQACSLLSRNLRPEEWRDYGSPEVTYAGTCKINK